MTEHTHTFETLDDGSRLCFECDEKRPPIGGSRVGAGRPKELDSPKTITVRVPATDFDWLLGNRGGDE